MSRRARIALGTTCRGGGKIYVLLRTEGVDGCELEVEARARGEQVPARVVRLDDGRYVLVLYVLQATQTVTVVAHDASGCEVARMRSNVGRRAARLKSVLHTLLHDPAVDLMRACDVRPRAGELELVWSRVIAGAGARDLVQALVTYPLVGEPADGQKPPTPELAAYLPDGRRVSEDDVRLLGECVAPHARIPEVRAYYACYSVAVPCDVESVALSPLPQSPRGWESLWIVPHASREVLPASGGRPIPDPADSVTHHDSDIVILRSPDVVCDEDAVYAQLARDLEQEGVGLVGARVDFFDTTKARGALVIPHLTCRIANYLLPRELEGRDCVERRTHEVLAVCGELIALRRSTWEAVGGMSAGANERAQFVDLCLKVRELGLSVVEDPLIEAHIPMTARDMGVASQSERLVDVAADAWLKQRWPEVFGLPDPYYDVRFDYDGHYTERPPEPESDKGTETPPTPDKDPAYDGWLRNRHRASELDLVVQREVWQHWDVQPTFCVLTPDGDADGHGLPYQTYPNFEVLSLGQEPTGDYVLELGADDVLEPDALWWFAHAAAQHPDADLIYCEEDRLVDGAYGEPFFKTDWDPDRLRYQDCIGHAYAQRTGTPAIRHAIHVPRVLWHTGPEARGGQEARGGLSPVCLSGGDNNVAEGAQGTVLRVPTPNVPPLVSIVIPNKDAPDVLERCVSSILDLTTWPSYEVVIVENNSELTQTFELYDRLRQQNARVRVVTCVLENGFNFSRLVNYGFVQARGNYLLMLNNDTEVLQADWIDRMMATCKREEVGCVGAKLLYPNDTIQHVGVFVGSHLGPWHANLGDAASDPGYRDVNVTPHRMRAVTGACLLVSRELWQRVGGLDEELPVDYNDVDFCLQIDALGLGVVVQVDVVLRHYESVSRGDGRSPEAAVRFAHAEGLLRERWGALIFGEDPYFNPNFRHNTGRYVLDA